MAYFMEPIRNRKVRYRKQIRLQNLSRSNGISISSGSQKIVVPEPHSERFGGTVDLLLLTWFGHLAKFDPYGL